jgi:hypothetical protein
MRTEQFGKLSGYEVNTSTGGEMYAKENKTISINAQL